MFHGNRNARVDGRRIVNILRLFVPLAEFETRIADLYEWFSVLFAGDWAAEFTFYRLATEERAHASLIDYQRRSVLAEPTAFGDVTANLQEVADLGAEVAKVRGSMPPPNLGQAIALALRLESSAAEYHVRTAMRQANPRIALLLDNLGKGDQQHVDGLRHLAVHCGVAALRAEA